MEFVFRRSYRGPLKAVVLDWAGTTVDYGSFAPTAVFIRLFEAEGVSISPQAARAGMGLMKKDHLRMILAQPEVAQAWHVAHDAAATDGDVDRLFERFVPLQLSVLESYAEPIPGLEAVLADLRARNLRIGSTTGYTRPMMDVLLPVSQKNGYSPDCVVCPDEVPAGRPFPWMCYQNAIQLQVFPMEALVKVGDTLVDVEEGLNAGMWTVGVSLTGNLLGLGEHEVQALTTEERQGAARRIGAQLAQAGAHYIIEGIWDLPAVLDRIQASLAHGESPRHGA